MNELISNITKIGLDINSDTALQIANLWFLRECIRFGCLTVLLLGIVGIIVYSIRKVS